MYNMNLYYVVDTFSVFGPTQYHPMKGKWLSSRYLPRSIICTVSSYEDEVLLCII